MITGNNAFSSSIVNNSHSGIIVNNSTSGIIVNNSTSGIIGNNNTTNIIYVFILIIVVIILLNLNRIKNLWAIIFNFDLLTRVILFVIPLAGIIGMLVPLLLGMSNFTLLGSYLAIPMILASLIYWLYFYRARPDDTEQNEGR